MSSAWKTFKPYLLITPQTLVFILFLVFPIVMIGVVSFWQFNGYSMVPSFTLDNYRGIFTSDDLLGAAAGQGRSGEPDCAGDWTGESAHGVFTLL